jgi:tripartite-type tricarboxylate transporter receptor subunit TctC
MAPHRRHVLHLAAALAIVPRLARAQAWPERPIRLVVGFVAGGPNDILARLIAPWLSARFGQPVVVENNASSDAATAMVARSPADGYTLMLIGPANAIAVTLSPDRDVDLRRDLMPVAGLTREALALVVHPSVPAMDVESLLAYAQTHSGGIRLAITGIGGAPHIAGELFRRMTGIDATPVAFTSGALAVRALVAGEVQAMFEPMSAAIGPVREGKLRALAVTTAERATALPAVPAMTEFLLGFETSAVTGIAAPRGTPADVIARLNAAINAAYEDAGLAARFADTGGETIKGPPMAFGKVFGEEIAKWRKLLALSGVKAEER